MKPMEKVKIALIQMSCSEDSEHNLQKCLESIDEASRRGAQIIVTPELFRSRYFCQIAQHSHFELAEPIPGPTTDALSRVASHRGVAIVGTVFERRAAGVHHNTAVVIDSDGKLLGMYRKTHIVDNSRYYEGFYMTPGDLGFRCFNTKFGKIGVLIGWDQWFPEAARITALTGVHLLVLPTAIGWDPRDNNEYREQQYSAWETMQRGHAIANGIYVATVNRVGFEPVPALDYPPSIHKGVGTEFWGQSFIASPWGSIVAKAGAEEEKIVLAECDFSKIEVQRTHWPYLRDRRLDAYGEITKRAID